MSSVPFLTMRQAVDRRLTDGHRSRWSGDGGQCTKVISEAAGTEIILEAVQEMQAGVILNLGSRGGHNTRDGGGIKFEGSGP
jgi:hypothetical protein